MVCYARPASRIAALVVIAFVVFGHSIGHYLGAAALVTTIALATAVAAVAAALVFAAFLSTRRRRALAGGCVGCRFRCQHAMTEQPQRLRLVTIVDRTPTDPTARPAVTARPATAARHATAARAARVTGEPVLVRLSAGPDAPQWPDRPVRRSPSAVGS